ncbi:hypothetical protein T01_10379 [Trichinella spiralis]|uniref:Uncharacterized protein n=1 Tax=Trichinella spiralis TaxID=6334 RepID=A0A0V1AHD0_TRISP|nr:hypothetical protein T01_10379 [Trichinella spiralis]
MDNVFKAVNEKVSTIPCVSRPSLILVVPLAQRWLTLQIRRNAVLSTYYDPVSFRLIFHNYSAAIL